MKKTLSLIIAVAMVLGVALTASAAVTVQVTLTSPTITKAPGSCEKAGAVTFSFPAGAVLTAGDWWYMDLPENATLCKSIDFLIIDGDNALGANHMVAVDSTLPTSVQFLDPTDALSTLPVVGGAGPMKTVATVGAGNDTVVSAHNMALRVVGVQGSRRVTLYLAGDAAAIAAPGTITVGADSVLNIKILDGEQHNTAGGVIGTTRIITDTNKLSYGTKVAGVLTGAIDLITPDYAVDASAKFKLFGQHTGDTMPAGVLAVTKNEFVGTLGGIVPFVENTLCVNAEKATGNLHVSFASKNDKYTFSGDSQIAHTGAASTITLKSCVPAKSSADDQILIGEQNKCFFDYETAGGLLSGYCPTHPVSAVYLESSSVFGELDDKYDVIFESKTAGVYFGGAATIGGLTDAQTICKDAATAVTTTNDFCAGTTCSAAGGDVLFVTGTPCTIETKNQISKIFTFGGLVTPVHTYKYLVFNFANFVYDKAVVKDGTEAIIQVTLEKYPCGQIFTAPITIGTFVTTCTSAATGSDTLLFPYLIGTKFNGWFSGFVISNGSTKEGTAVLTAMDQNGNKATFTTPVIAAGSHYNCSFLTAADWSQDSANTANFDMTESFTVKVLCNFDDGSGIAFLGNMNEGYAIGYGAESKDW